MRYVIVGAGAIGGVLGGRLAQHSHDNRPLLIARGEHGEAVAARGLRVRSPEADDVVRVATASGPDDVRLRADDVLVFATKTQALATAIAQWVDQPVYAAGGGAAAEGTAAPATASTADASAAGATPECEPLGTAGDLLPVFTALNGVESERLALRFFRRVFGVTVWLPGVHLTPGEVVVRIAPSSGTFIIGRYGASADDSDRTLLDTLRADWEAASFRVFLVDDVMAWKHRKLLSNLGNALQALLGPDAAGSDALLTRLRDEAEDVYRAAGIRWPSAEAEKEWRGNAFDIRPVPGIEGTLGGSSWQSIQRGSGSIESDFLNGEIALLARLHGREAPLNAAVQRLARQAAAGGALAGSLTVEQLAAQLDEAAAAGALRA